VRDERARRQQSSGVTVLSRPNPFGRVMAYPFTGTGCAYSLCSQHTDLPRQVRSLPQLASTSWTWRGTTSGEWNASYDLWFDKTSQVTTQDNGAELMIWLRTMPGYPAGRPVYVAGRWMRFMTWRTGHNGMYWNYVQFRFPGTVHSVRNLPLWPFIRYAVRHHLIRRGWWLTSVHAGYELWSGGRGLSTTWFDART
jgi:hypothetical protein